MTRNAGGNNNIIDIDENPLPPLIQENAADRNIIINDNLINNNIEENLNNNEQIKINEDINENLNINNLINNRERKSK